MILSAQSIRALCGPEYGSAPPVVRHEPMIFPFRERAVTGGKSHGLSCCGYDVRIAETVTLWPKCNRLASTVERFVIPTNVMARVHDKSSWARRFVHVHNTVIEPGWRGYLTLELANASWRPLTILAGTPIAQLVFEYLDFHTEQPYRGKYQNQRSGPVPAVDEPDAVVFGHSMGGR